jgi:K+-sensing histidine kinase KdpD
MNRFKKISTADFRTLLDKINLAADLGAEVVGLKSPDVIKALLDLAQEAKDNPHYRRTNASLLCTRFHRSIGSRIFAKAQNFEAQLASRDTRRRNHESAFFYGIASATAFVLGGLALLEVHQLERAMREHSIATISA